MQIHNDAHSQRCSLLLLYRFARISQTSILQRFWRLDPKTGAPGITIKVSTSIELRLRRLVYQITSRPLMQESSRLSKMPAISTADRMDGSAKSLFALLKNRNRM
jgi:hypothetical protein